MTDIKVQKRDGSEEAWSEDKLISSIVKTGATIETANIVSGRVSQWLQDVSANGTITSDKVRDMVTQYLREADTTAAGIYETYKKTAS